MHWSFAFWFIAEFFRFCKFTLHDMLSSRVGCNRGVKLGSTELHMQFTWQKGWGNRQKSTMRALEIICIQEKHLHHRVIWWQPETWQHMSCADSQNTGTGWAYKWCWAPNSAYGLKATMLNCAAKSMLFTLDWIPCECSIQVSSHSFTLVTIKLIEHFDITCLSKKSIWSPKMANVWIGLKPTWEPPHGVASLQYCARRLRRENITENLSQLVCVKSSKTT